eukprot:3571815-Alexandrium_andersonii.AAC.1
MVPEALEECILRPFSRRFRICPRKRASTGSEVAKSQKSKASNPKCSDPQSAQSFATGAR